MLKRAWLQRTHPTAPRQPAKKCNKTDLKHIIPKTTSFGLLFLGDLGAHVWKSRFDFEITSACFSGMGLGYYHLQGVAHLSSKRMLIFGQMYHPNTCIERYRSETLGVLTLYGFCRAKMRIAELRFPCSPNIHLMILEMNCQKHWEISIFLCLDGSPPGNHTSFGIIGSVWFACISHHLSVQVCSQLKLIK